MSCNEGLKVRHLVGTIVAGVLIGLIIVWSGVVHAADHGTPPGPVILHKADDLGQPIPDVPDELALDEAQQAAVNSYAPPLSAIAVTCNGLAVSLFIQLDADHLFRADPRQSDMFTNVKGKMVHSTAPPMEWKVAYALAERAILSSHVTVPCADGPAI